MEEILVDIQNDVSADSVRKQMAEKPPPALQVLLEFNHLNYQIKIDRKTTKTILTDVSGYARPGELTVIMGPTGSGKTSLMTCLAKRTNKCKGEILINGQPPSKHYKRQVGYVMQDDVLFPSLTVYQTLLFTCRLRLGHLTRKEQEQKVEDVITGLGLKRARDTMIGGEFFRGVSGGERKRVNIGNEILTNPSLIMLDEPTSGLDTSTALSLMQMLKGMAESGLTILCTIHQPSSQMWALFDNLMLLVEGEMIYFGRAQGALDYFSSIGLHCESSWNPADFIMGIILSEEIAKKQGKSLKAQMVNIWKKKSLEPAYATNVEEQKDVLEHCLKNQGEAYTGNYSLNFFEQIYILTARTWYLNMGKIYDIFQWAQLLIIGLLIGIVWFQTDFTTGSYIQRGALVFFSFTYIAGFNPAFEALFAFPMDRAVVVRERASGSYRLSSYYIAKFLVEIPWYFPGSMFFFLIFYFMARLHYDAGAFFETYFIIILCIFTSTSFGLMVSAATIPNMRLGMTTMTVLSLIFLATGGFFVQSYPIWMNWVQYTSYYKYSFNALIASQSNRILFLDTTNFTNGMNETVPGEVLARHFYTAGFPYEVGINCAIVFGFGWLFRIAGFFFLSWSIKGNSNIA